MSVARLYAPFGSPCIAFKIVNLGRQMCGRKLDCNTKASGKKTKLIIVDAIAMLFKLHSGLFALVGQNLRSQ